MDVEDGAADAPRDDDDGGGARRASFGGREPLTAVSGAAGLVDPLAPSRVARADICRRKAQ